MRKHYIDNLRNLTILLLFPVHTFMVWNDFGVRFYVWGGESRLLSTLIVVVNPWFMPILFAVAGISARYSLEKRSAGAFFHERVHKLLIPFLCGMVLLVPVQTLYARKFFFGYDGGVLGNLKYFFTHLTDFSGYDGGFTPGQLWFILFLFLISVAALLLHRFVPYAKVGDKVGRMPLWGIIGLFVPVWLLYYIGNFGGFSLGKSLAMYLAGYYVLSSDAVIDKLVKSRWLLTGIYTVSAASLVIAYYLKAFYGDISVNFVGWMGILVLLVWGKRYLDRKTAVTDYFNRASFPVYILHQSILVVVAYYVLKAGGTLPVQVLVICGGSFLLTILCYHVVGYVPLLREAIGISGRRKRKEHGKG